MKILINGELRDATAEEKAERELTRADAKAVEQEIQDKKIKLAAKFAELGFEVDDLKALGLA